MVISEIEKFLSQLNDKIVSRVGNKIQEAKKQAIIDGKEYEANIFSSKKLYRSFLEYER